jgi:hypothetical protein
VISIKAKKEIKGIISLTEFAVAVVRLQLAVCGLCNGDDGAKVVSWTCPPLQTMRLMPSFSSP